MPIWWLTAFWKIRYVFWFILILPTTTFWASNVYQSCKGLKQNQRLLCALLTSAWYFMVLPATRREKTNRHFWGKTPPWCDSAFESDLPEFWGKMQRRIPQRFGRLAIKTVPTSPRFGSCKVTSFDKNAGQIRTQMPSHWQHMTAWSQLKAFNSLASSWVLASSNSSLVSITSIIVWLSWSDSHV